MIVVIKERRREKELGEVAYFRIVSFFCSHPPLAAAADNIRRVSTRFNFIDRPMSSRRRRASGGGGREEEEGSTHKDSGGGVAAANESSDQDLVSSGQHGTRGRGAAEGSGKGGEAAAGGE
jgi:hypothetical protein